jgi:hypothetical protein
VKRFLPLLLLLAAPSAQADYTHSIQSSASITVVAPGTVTTRQANEYSISGSGVDTTDGTTAGVLGGLGDATNGVNALTSITASQATDGEAFSFSQSYTAGDEVSDSAPTVGEVPNFSNVTSTTGGTLGDAAITVDNFSITTEGGDAGTVVTGQFVTTLTVD